MCKHINHPYVYLLSCFWIYIWLETRDIHIHAVCKPVSAVLKKVSHTHSCTHNLAAGCKVEHNILCHWNNLRVNALVSVCLHICNLSIPYN